MYDASTGRPSIDPEVALRLMLAGFLLGFVHDRRLMREAQVNLAIRWFCGYGLHETLPDHSSLTRIRQRWGAERFRRIFERTVTRLPRGEDREGRDRPYRCLADPRRRQLGEPGRPPRRGGGGGERRARGGGTAARARPASTRRSAPPIPTRRWRPTRATGGSSRPSSSTRRSTISVGSCSTSRSPPARSTRARCSRARSTRSMALTGETIVTVTADAGYAYAKVYGALERRGIDAVIPAKAEPIRSPVPLRRFRYDARHDIVKCPQRSRSCVRSGRSSTAGSSTPAPGTARAVRCAGSACRRAGSTRRS